MASAIDPTKPVAGNPTTESVRLNFAAAKSEIEVLQQTAGVGPQGPIGPTGPSGQVAVGTVTTTAPGTNATVNNVGTATSAVLNFSIPRGDAGTVGGGITETQAVDAVRQGQVRFQEANITNAPAAFPTSPNIATTDPVVSAGWELTAGSGAGGTYTHTGGTGVLAYPVTITQDDIYQFVFTATSDPWTSGEPRFFDMYFRTAPTTAAGQQQVGFRNTGGTTTTTRAVATFSHLVIVPNSAWRGTFTLTRVVRATTHNSFTFNLKDNRVVVKGNSLYFGGGGEVAATDTQDNTAFGLNTLAGNTTGNGNTAVGFYALSGSSSGNQNSAFGWRALNNNGTGANNCAFGAYASMSNTSGSGNVSMGRYALNYNSTGGNNTALGYLAMLQNLAGNNNVAIGHEAMRMNYTGLDNTIIGAQSYREATAGNQNVTLGYWAGRYLANGSTVLLRADNSIFIGYHSRSNANNQTNQIVIGANAQGGGSNTITLGDGSITQLRCNVQDISALSDVRVKDEIQLADLNLCFDAVKNLPVHRWHWQPVAGFRRDRHVTGFLSGELKKVWPHRVMEADEYLVVRDADGNPVYKTVTEVVEPDEDGGMPEVETRQIQETVKIERLARVELTEVLPTLWGAVQRLIQKNEALEKQLAELKPSGEPKPAAEAKPSILGGGARRK